MTKKELIEILSETEDDAEVCVQIDDSEGVTQSYGDIEVEADDDQVFIILPKSVTSDSKWKMNS